MPKKVVKVRPEFEVPTTLPPLPRVLHHSDDYLLALEEKDRAEHPEKYVVHDIAPPFPVRKVKATGHLSRPSSSPHSRSPSRSGGRSGSRSRSPTGKRGASPQSRTGSRGVQRAVRPRSTSPIANAGERYHSPSGKIRTGEVAARAKDAHTRMANLLDAEYSIYTTGTDDARRLNAASLADRILPHAVAEVTRPSAAEGESAKMENSEFSPRTEQVDLALTGTSLSPKQVQQLKESPAETEGGADDVHYSDSKLEPNAVEAVDVEPLARKKSVKAVTSKTSRGTEPHATTHGLRGPSPASSQTSLHSAASIPMHSTTVAFKSAPSSFRKEFEASKKQLPSPGAPDAPSTASTSAKQPQESYFTLLGQPVAAPLTGSPSSKSNGASQNIDLSNLVVETEEKRLKQEAEVRCSCRAQLCVVLDRVLLLKRFMWIWVEIRTAEYCVNSLVYCP